MAGRRVLSEHARWDDRLRQRSLHTRRPQYPARLQLLQREKQGAVREPDLRGDPRRPHQWRLSLHLRSEEHTSELQSLMRISYAVFSLKKTKNTTPNNQHT